MALTKSGCRRAIVRKETSMFWRKHVCNNKWQCRRNLMDIYGSKQSLCVGCSNGKTEILNLRAVGEKRTKMCSGQAPQDAEKKNGGNIEEYMVRTEILIDSLSLDA